MAHYFHPIDPFLLSEITERLVKKKIIIGATPPLPKCCDLEQRPSFHSAPAI